ncbi:transglutaminaseTgpA domain-containing protein [Georgenia sp. AZ-5]|uniref:transglutaminase family protein n=1 Tax=Georgenia sp. AZ-5 TaxID=3367526 RepID=UPI0037542AF5
MSPGAAGTRWDDRTGDATNPWDDGMGEHPAPRWGDPAAARWGDAVLAALATAVAAWPVGPLLREATWVPATLLALVVVVVAGSLARRARLGAGRVLLAQAAAVALLTSWLLLPGQHWYGLPLPGAGLEALRLVDQGLATIRDDVVPVAANPGMTFVVVTALCAVALAVDLIGVTLRSPALAGLPLLLVVTIGASGTGEPLHPRYFLTAVVPWLVLLGRHGAGSLRVWRDRVHPASAGLRRSAHRYAGWGRSLAGAAVVLAVLVPAALPHRAPVTLVQALNRAAGVGDDGEVTFTETLDLSADLASRSPRPVLRYRTDDAQGVPLRVTASMTYDGRRWQPADDVLADAGQPPGPPAGMETELHALTVFHNELRAPQVAVPYPLLGADFGQIPWAVDEATGVATVAEHPGSYEAVYWRPAGDLPDGAGTGPVPELDPRTLELDPASHDLVVALATDVAGGAATQVQAAMAIQSYLRGSAFTYSLTLAPPVDGPDGAPLDPISHFLETKVGYCVQFATAMVMMSRALGIPARLAVGFLPGAEDDDGARTVRAADAHAWPELYITGVGWTRFEPTPGARTGVAPVYRTPADPDAATPTQAPSAAPEGPLREDPEDAETAAPERSPWVAGAAQAATWLAGAALAAAALALVPLAGRWRRGAARRRADDDASVVEGEWQALTASLADLGVRAPRGATPRQAQEHYARAAGLDPPTAAALARAAGRVQAARYAPGGAGVGTMAEDVREVAGRVRAALPWRRRLAAALWPRSGTEQLRDLGAAAHRRLGRLADSVARLLDR